VEPAFIVGINGPMQCGRNEQAAVSGIDSRERLLSQVPKINLEVPSFTPSSDSFREKVVNTGLAAILKPSLQSPQNIVVQTVVVRAFEYARNWQSIRYDRCSRAPTSAQSTRNLIPGGIWEFPYPRGSFPHMDIDSCALVLDDFNVGNDTVPTPLRPVNDASINRPDACDAR
jgi:hypothetical protein